MRHTSPVPRFGRAAQFDERSRAYPIRAMLDTSKPLRSYTWRCRTVLNQGWDSSCVGCAWSHELAARPVEVRGVTYRFAEAVYERAKKIDMWEGEDYLGTSVLAGAKVLRNERYIREFRWAFGLQDVLLTLGYRGPVVLGLTWREGMEHPSLDGRIRPTGDVTGGHAIAAVGVSVRGRTVTLLNSWGKYWGQNGRCWLTWDDLGALLDDAGEACVPLRRARMKRLARLR